MAVRKFEPMSEGEIALHSQKQKTHFKQLKNQSEKTKVYKSDDFTHMIRHYDKSNNYLYDEHIYTQDNQYKTVYVFKGSNGGHVTFIDRDTDGNIDEMQYVDRQNYPQYKAYDEDDNGTFDTAKRRIKDKEYKINLYF